MLFSASKWKVLSYVTWRIWIIWRHQCFNGRLSLGLTQRISISRNQSHLPHLDEVHVQKFSLFLIYLLQSRWSPFPTLIPSYFFGKTHLKGEMGPNVHGLTSSPANLGIKSHNYLLSLSKYRPCRSRKESKREPFLNQILILQPKILTESEPHVEVTLP